jgi:hypothetical protein
MRRPVLASALASTALALGSVAIAPAASAAEQSQTVHATGASQSFTVPTGVQCLSVNAYAGAGGASTTSTASRAPTVASVVAPSRRRCR